MVTEADFPPNNSEFGKVSFRIEAWPHDSGANGEEYNAGHLPAADVARILRDIADRCESWADPECPWSGQSGHAPARPTLDSEEQHQAKEIKHRVYVKKGK